MNEAALVPVGRAGRNWLDDDRELFCRLIVSRLGVVAAYRQSMDRRADEDTALEMGSSLARVPEVAERIEVLEEDRVLLRNTTKESVASDYIRMTRVNASDYFNEDWTLKKKELWSEDMKLACKSIERTKYGWKLDMYDRTVVMDKIVGMMNLKPDIPAGAGAVDDMRNKSDAELQEIIGAGEG